MTAELRSLCMASNRVTTHVYLSVAGLGFVPLPACPVYSATKAAVRSFTKSVRVQLRKTSVHVIDVIPPAVQTDLHDYMGPPGKQARPRTKHDHPRANQRFAMHL